MSVKAISISTPVSVITNAGVYDFEPESKRMRIKTLHPGVSADLAQLACGFELLKPDKEIPVTETPSDEILGILRNDRRNSNLYTKIFHHQ